MKILVDASLVLELFLNRSGQVEQAEEFLDVQQNNFADVYVTDKCLDDIAFYLAKPDTILGHEVSHFLNNFFGNRIITIKHDHIQKARTYTLKNFDSAVQLACADNFKLDAIVTIFPDNFVGSHIPIYKVNQFLQSCYSQQRHHLEILFKSSIENQNNFGVSGFLSN